MSLEDVKVGTQIELENGYRATITSIDESNQGFRFEGAVDARSGIIYERWSIDGTSSFFTGFDMFKVIL